MSKHGWIKDWGAMLVDGRVRSELGRLRYGDKVGDTQAKAALLPLIWGQARVPVRLIEKFAPLNQGYPAWSQGTRHGVGDYIITSDSGFWRCVRAGTSGDVEPTRERVEYEAMERSHYYAVGDVAYRDLDTPYPFGRYYHVCTAAGTTGESNPVVNYYADMEDGGVTWHMAGAHGAAAIPADLRIEETDYIDGTCVWRYRQQFEGAGWWQSFFGAVCEDAAASPALIALWSGTKKYDNALDFRSQHPDGAPLALTWRGVPTYSAPDWDIDTDVFDDSGYRGVIGLYADNAQLETGSQIEMPELGVELWHRQGTAQNPDVHPIDILTHESELIGGFADGVATQAGIEIETVSWRDWPLYCSAAGLYCSLVIDEQVSALDVIGRVLQATNSDAVWSAGKLKIVPLADQAITSPIYGSTAYEPDLDAAYNLGPDDFLPRGDQAIEILRRGADDQYTRYTVGYIDRSEGYSERKATYVDAAAIEAGAADREASEISLGVIFPDARAPTMLAQAAAQRATYSRNEYRFGLSWRYSLLEPLDIVTLTEPALGLDLVPVRITEISESLDGIDVTAEDWPAGIAVSGGYQPQIGDGVAPDEPSSLAHQVSVVDGFRSVTDMLAIPSTSIARTSSVGELLPNPDFEITTPTEMYGLRCPDSWIPYTSDADGDNYRELCTGVSDRLWGDALLLSPDGADIGDTAVRIVTPETPDGGPARADHTGIIMAERIPIRPGRYYRFLMRARLTADTANSDAIPPLVFARCYGARNDNEVSGQVIVAVHDTLDFLDEEGGWQTIGYWIYIPEDNPYQSTYWRWCRFGVALPPGAEDSGITSYCDLSRVSCQVDATVTSEGWSQPSGEVSAGIKRDADIIIGDTGGEYVLSEIPLDTELSDAFDMWDAGAPYDIVVPQGGTWRINTYLTLSSLDVADLTTVGYRVYRDSELVHEAVLTPWLYDLTISYSSMVDLQPNDVVRLVVGHYSPAEDPHNMTLDHAQISVTTYTFDDW